jgi:starvation-inducible DNA-binding protein
LFGKIYEEVYESIDDFAEKIRSIGSYMPGSYTRFSMLSQIDDTVEVLPVDQMLATLYEDNEKMLVTLKVAYDIAEQVGEHGFSSFIADRMDAHRKHGWMLRASLK